MTEEKMMGKKTLGGMESFDTEQEFAVWLHSKGWTSGFFRKCCNAGAVYGLYPEEVDEICKELTRLEKEDPFPTGPTTEDIMRAWSEKLKKMGWEKHESQ